MYLSYFDEVKYQPPAQDCFLLGGISVNVDHVGHLESQVSELARQVFGNGMLTKETEFHGRDILQGKANFKGKSCEYRLEVLRELIRILDQPELVHKTWVAIYPENLVATSMPAEDIGFMYFVEQIDALLSRQSAKGVLFGDYDDPVIGSTVASLSRFRHGGTFWRRSREIQNLVDTVHFAHSHHSRMIQLADIFVYCIQFFRSGRAESWMRKSLMDFIKNETGLTSGCNIRSWPTQKAWYSDVGIVV